MNIKSIVLTLLFGSYCILATPSFAQTDTVDVSKEKQLTIDDKNNGDRLNDAENLQKENKAKAKEASRISKNAADAAKQSKMAAKAERKAQKSRIDADKQAGKAAKATQKSEGN